ncbi:LIM/homeobox protein Lhx2 [Nymphon striatum]|nr:LIM/homeobox protein Lhx2 [Nymphon striatum]
MLITCVKSNETTNTVEDLKFTEVFQNDLNCYIAPSGFLVPKYPIELNPPMDIICSLRNSSKRAGSARKGSVFVNYRIFAQNKCGRCRTGILSSEMVMRVRDVVYHVQCFTCAWCNTILSQGDHFGMKEGLVYCRAHYEIILQGEHPSLSEGIPSPSSGMNDTNGHHFYTSSSRSSPIISSHSPHHSPYYHHQTVVNSVRKGRPRKRKINQDTSAAAVQSIQDLQDAGALHDDITNALGLEGRLLDGNSLGQAERNLLNHQNPRAKRMRTSFKHHQLRTMKSYFSVNQNPDAKDLKQLAQKTGLSKRVLQVWFQNARAKWRRNTLRQEGKGQDMLQSDGNSSTPPSLSELGGANSNNSHMEHMLSSPNSMTQQTTLQSLMSSTSEIMSESDERSRTFHDIF